MPLLIKEHPGTDQSVNYKAGYVVSLAGNQ